MRVGFRGGGSFLPLNSLNSYQRYSLWQARRFKQLIMNLFEFTTNSFSLTTPSLSPIGVVVSPLAALINHSCAPNAVVVFPRHMAHSPTPLAVIALRDIEPGEEVSGNLRHIPFDEC